MLQDITQRQKYILLFVLALFFLVYFMIGLSFKDTPLYEENNIFLDTDTRSVYQTFLDSRSAHRAGVHPFFKVIVRPVYASLHLLIGSQQLSVLLMSVAIGTIQIFVLFLVVYQRFKLDFTPALFYTLLYGISISNSFSVQSLKPIFFRVCFFY